MTDQPGGEFANPLTVAADAVAEETDSDILVVNSEIWAPIDFHFMRLIAARKVRKKLFFILVTEGGSSDSAFRMMRCLQGKYSHVTVIVPGWCKSAGTLMCIGAHELQIGELGELGPLDVQIVKADEMDEQKSGLTTEAAFEKLQQEAFKLFIGFVRQLGSTEYRITLKTAAEIARHVTVGLISPIFEKLDPVTIGEDYRSNRLAFSYAERLNLTTQNLVKKPGLDPLEILLSGYSSHGFVIDSKEAATLFRNVKPICAAMSGIVAALGADAVIPRDRRQGQGPKLEFLNNEPRQPETADAPGIDPAQDNRPNGGGDGAGELRGNPEAGNGAEATPPPDIDAASR